MGVGARARVLCSPAYAYGEKGFQSCGIQENSPLLFDIEILEIT